ncbi:unnamed protein product [Vitrella brassicaformis CCMP3155]|uniref:Uncharacterized protein n=2 Tax=Vitrella brassicaformis TaxID=1169539 RepID=A0A0G4EH33_VITBC|nr:unnamed protein product [Vitrella brassicaformis CCMP3155]|eukprot:CEL95324.1 unnamed protein product [Vitrella brassicaformis CCMP3155]
MADSSVDAAVCKAGGEPEPEVPARETEAPPAEPPQKASDDDSHAPVSASSDGIAPDVSSSSAAGLLREADDIIDSLKQWREDTHKRLEEQLRSIQNDHVPDGVPLAGPPESNAAAEEEELDVWLEEQQQQLAEVSERRQHIQDQLHAIRAEGDSGRLQQSLEEFLKRLRASQVLLEEQSSESNARLSALRREIEEMRIRAGETLNDAASITAPSQPVEDSAAVDASATLQEMLDKWTEELEGILAQDGPLASLVDGEETDRYLPSFARPPLPCASSESPPRILTRAQRDMAENAPSATADELPAEMVPSADELDSTAFRGQIEELEHMMDELLEECDEVERLITEALPEGHGHEDALAPPGGQGQEPESSPEAEPSCGRSSSTLGASRAESTN